MTRKQVLFCIKGLGNQGGGAERVLVDVANGLVARGYGVKVLSYDRPGSDTFYPLEPQIGWIQLGIGSTRKRASVFETIARIFALRQRVRKENPDIVIGFMHSMFIPLGIAMIGLKPSPIASEHIVPAHYKTRPLEALLLRLTPFLVSTITCVSPQARALYPSSIRRKMVAVANPVTIAAKGRADVLAIERQRKTILSVGRLEEQKGHEVLLKAFALVADEFPAWDLRIIGEGVLRDDLENLAKHLKIENRVYMPGATKEIASEYLDAQLFVMPSRYESFGLTLVEAFAHGLPAIGFDDCPGVSMLINSGTNGLLAKGEQNRVLSLALAMRFLIGDDDLRQTLAQNTVDVVKEYALDNVLDQWEDLWV